MLWFSYTCTYPHGDFVAENLAAGHDVQVPELGLLSPVKVELEQNRLEHRECLKVEAQPRFLPVVEYV